MAEKVTNVGSAMEERPFKVASSEFPAKSSGRRAARWNAHENVRSVARDADFQLNRRACLRHLIGVRFGTALVTTDRSSPPSAWILYDGECGFCSRWGNSWAKTLRKRGFEPAALQEPWVAEKLQMPIDALLVDIRLLSSDGKLISGADVYLHGARRIWWAWLFYAMFSLPGLNWLLHAGYRWLARNRYCISPSCKLRPR